MMQSFTKTELKWIYKALREEADANALIMVENSPDSVEYKLANIARENARSVMRKIDTVIKNNSKRIEIKA